MLVVDSRGGVRLEADGAEVHSGPAATLLGWLRTSLGEGAPGGAFGLGPRLTLLYGGQLLESLALAPDAALTAAATALAGAGAGDAVAVLQRPRLLAAMAVYREKRRPRPLVWLGIGVAVLVLAGLLVALTGVGQPAPAGATPRARAQTGLRDVADSWICSLSSIPRSPPGSLQARAPRWLGRARPSIASGPPGRRRPGRGPPL